MSSETTENIGLHKWIPTDYVKMDEFNDNFDKIDQVAGDHDARLADTSNDLKQRSINVRQPPYNAPADGQSHPLSERFSTLADAQAIFTAAKDLSDEIDWAAIQSAIDNNREINLFLPQGDYVLNKEVKLTYYGSSSLTGNIYGVNSSQTILTFTNHAMVSELGNGHIADLDAGSKMPIGISAFPTQDVEISGIQNLTITGISVVAPNYGTAFYIANSARVCFKDVVTKNNLALYGFTITQCISIEITNSVCISPIVAGINLRNKLADADTRVYRLSSYFNDTIILDNVKFGGNTWSCIIDDGSVSFGQRSIKNCSSSSAGFSFYVGGCATIPMFESNWNEGCKYVYYFMGTDRSGNFPDAVGASLQNVPKSIITAPYCNGAIIRGCKTQNEQCFITADIGAEGNYIVVGNYIDYNPPYFANVNRPAVLVNMGNYINDPSASLTSNDSSIIQSKYFPLLSSKTNHIIENNNYDNQVQVFSSTFRGKSNLSSVADYEGFVISFQRGAQNDYPSENYFSGSIDIEIVFSGKKGSPTGFIQLRFELDAMTTGNNPLNRVLNPRILDYSANDGQYYSWETLSDSDKYPKVSISTFTDNTANITVRCKSSVLSAIITAKIVGSNRLGNGNSDINTIISNDQAFMQQYQSSDWLTY